MANPILVEVTRGTLVESIHRGSLLVTRSSGEPILAIGDVTETVFARSSIKLVQALPLIETGAADQFGFGAAEIALACGSHVGSDRHVAVARGMIERLELTESCLACGAAVPTGTKAAQTLAARGERPTAFHHQCSGKHAGMLAVAKSIASFRDPQAYTAASHPTQRAVRAALEDLAAAPVAANACGIDGCAVPTWALPLDRLARVFAIVASGHGLSASRRAAIARILAACWAEPELVAGAGRAETIIMAALPGRIYLKSGAEGVYCGALPELGIGFALKMDDGAQRASAGAVMPLVERLLPEAAGLVRRSVLRTPTGLEVGRIRSSQDYDRALDLLARATVGG